MGLAQPAHSTVIIMRRGETILTKSSLHSVVYGTHVHKLSAVVQVVVDVVAAAAVVVVSVDAVVCVAAAAASILHTLMEALSVAVAADHSHAPLRPRRRCRSVLPTSLSPHSIQAADRGVSPRWPHARLSTFAAGGGDGAGGGPRAGRHHWSSGKWRRRQKEKKRMMMMLLLLEKGRKEDAAGARRV